MNRPTITKFKKPAHISEYPVGPCFRAGHLVTKNASWRSEKPLLNGELCVNCLVCYLCCPEGVIFKSGDKVDIDYAFCKGCGICARECNKNAITMVREE